MATTKSRDDVAGTSAAYDRMGPRWHLLNTVFAGTRAMRAAAKEFLPAHPYESAEAYRDRRDSAVLLNYVALTVNNLTGKAFRNPPTLTTDSPNALQEFVEDVDGSGTGLEVFARKVFNCGLLKGLSHVLVDHSAATDPGEGAVRTRADDESEGVRPYWVHVDPENLIFAHVEEVDGHERYVHVRIREEVVEMDGFAEVTRERIRVLEPGLFRVYEKRTAGRGKKVEWVVIEEGLTDLDFVPLVTFYAGVKVGPAEAIPPLEDLAHLNVRHFQSSSDQDNVLTVARFPLLAVSGAGGEDEEGTPLRVGPRQWLSTPDPQGKFYYVEHTGAAIEAGRNDLKDLEDKMGAFGAEFLKARPGQATATGRALDSSESISPLQAMGVDFRDVLEVALGFTAAWLGLPEGEDAEVVFEVDNDLGLLDTSQLDVLDKARARKDISRRAYLEELKRRDVLDDSFDPEEDEELLDDEADTQGGLVGMGSALERNGVVVKPEEDTDPTEE